MSLFVSLFGPNIEKLESEINLKGLVKALTYQKDASVRWKAADALGKIGDTCAVEPLIAALEDSDRDVRYNAAEALGKIGGTRAVEPLIAALEDSDKDVHYVVVGVLRDIARNLEKSKPVASSGSGSLTDSDLYQIVRQINERLDPVFASQQLPSEFEVAFNIKRLLSACKLERTSSNIQKVYVTHTMNSFFRAHLIEMSVPFDDENLVDHCFRLYDKYGATMSNFAYLAELKGYIALLGRS